jgi:hypothetical protein
LIKSEKAFLVRANLMDVDMIVPGFGKRLDLLDMLRKVYANCHAPTSRYALLIDEGTLIFPSISEEVAWLRTGFPLILLSLREEAVSY